MSGEDRIDRRGTAGAPIRGQASEDPGHPIRVFRFALTPADALAWERLPSEARGWRKVGVFAPWVAVGLVWGATGDKGSVLLRLAVTGGAGLAVMLAGGALTGRARHRRALARVPAPCHEEVGEFGSHVSLQRLDPPGPVATIAPDMIRQVVLAPGHVFLDAPPHLVILPLAAFTDAADMAAFAARWQDRLDDDDRDETV